MKIVSMKHTCVHGRWPVKIPSNDISKSHVAHWSCAIPGRDGCLVDQIYDTACWERLHGLPRYYWMYMTTPLRLDLGLDGEYASMWILCLSGSSDGSGVEGELPGLESELVNP